MIVAPLSILGVWEEEFQKFAAFPYALAVLSGSSAKKLDTLRHMIGTALQVVVVNYESAWRLEKALTAWHPDLIIADEGHKIKTHNIAASKAMHRMGREASYRLLLTGTVITNKAIDVFSQYKFLNPAIYGNSFYAFRNRYFDMVGYQGGVYRESEDMVAAAKVRELMLPKSASMQAINDTVGQWKMLIMKPVQEINSNPFILNLQNGLYNTLDDSFKAHTPEYFSTVQLKAAYAPDAGCPLFLHYSNCFCGLLLFWWAEPARASEPCRFQTRIQSGRKLQSSKSFML